MKRLLTIITPEGITEQIGDNNLETLQKLVGGYIESVPHFSRYKGRKCVVYANDDGRATLPLNPIATSLWKSVLGSGPFIYEPELFGTIVIDQTYTGR